MVGQTLRCCPGVTAVVFDDGGACCSDSARTTAAGHSWLVRKRIEWALEPGPWSALPALSA